MAVTTGLKFPDALAGGPMVAHAGSAVVLVRETLEPAPADEIVRNDPADLVFLGTHPTVTNAVEASSRRLFDVVNGTATPVVTDPVPPMKPLGTALDRTPEESAVDESASLEQTRDEPPWLAPNG